ncbi:hypothetical protein B5F40_09050, partial [Gordonibacter sp. An230]|uniref:hypothetical protein n=1 Tax=Gordonibacter sp. An230 TaxID=1965592 RepID=UPI000B583769
ARAASPRRRAALAAAAVLALPLCPPGWLLPLAVQRAMGPSAEAAIEYANWTNGGDLSYVLESERTEPDGSVVYRLASTTEPTVHYEARYGFRWLPWEDIPQGGMMLPFVPPLENPGPYYELVNESEFLKEYNEWRSENVFSRKWEAAEGASSEERG